MILVECLWVVRATPIDSKALCLVQGALCFLVPHQLAEFGLDLDMR